MFEKPTVTLIKFELEDILAASGEIVSSESGTESVCTYDCSNVHCSNDLGVY